MDTKSMAAPQMGGRGRLRPTSLYPGWCVTGETEPGRRVVDISAGAAGLVHINVFLTQALGAPVNPDPRTKPLSLQAMAERIAALKTASAKRQQAHLLCVSLADLLRGNHVR